jgi:hypothetical protein
VGVGVYGCEEEVIIKFDDDDVWSVFISVGVGVLFTRSNKLRRI